MTALLKLPEVARRTGMGRSTIQRDVALGAFPRPVRVGSRAVRWVEAEVQGWIESKIRASREPVISGQGAA